MTHSISHLRIQRMCLCLWNNRLRQDIHNDRLWWESWNFSLNNQRTLLNNPWRPRQQVWIQSFLRWNLQRSHLRSFSCQFKRHSDWSLRRSNQRILTGWSDWVSCWWYKAGHETSHGRQQTLNNRGNECKSNFKLISCNSSTRHQHSILNRRHRTRNPHWKTLFNRLGRIRTWKRHWKHRYLTLRRSKDQHFPFSLSKLH